MSATFILLNHVFDEFTESIEVVQEVYEIRLQLILQQLQLIPVKLIIVSMPYKMTKSP